MKNYSTSDLYNDIRFDILNHFLIKSAQQFNNQQLLQAVMSLIEHDANILRYIKRLSDKYRNPNVLFSTKSSSLKKEPAWITAVDTFRAKKFAEWLIKRLGKESSLDASLSGLSSKTELKKKSKHNR